MKQGFGFRGLGFRPWETFVRKSLCFFCVQDLENFNEEVQLR